MVQCRERQKANLAYLKPPPKYNWDNSVTKNNIQDIISEDKIIIKIKKLKINYNINNQNNQTSIKWSLKCFLKPFSEELIAK